MQIVSSQDESYIWGTANFRPRWLLNNASHSEKMRRRLSAAYHIERSIAHRLGLPEYPCACNRCRGAVIKKVETVARHHSIHGRDPYLVYPVMVGQYIEISVILESLVTLLLGSARRCIRLCWLR